MAQALQPPPVDPDQAKSQQRLVDKLKYCKEVLTSIRNASATQLTGTDEEPGALANNGVSAKPSRASLR